MVTVLVLGNVLRDAVGDGEIDVEVSGPTTVKKLVEMNQAQLGALLPFIAGRETLITINKKIGSDDSLVHDGDTVKFVYQSRATYDGTRDIPV
jgi:sulfur-carrier protein